MMLPATAMGIARAAVVWGNQMRESYANPGFQSSFAERLEFVAQRLEGFAWLCLLACTGFAGYLVISM